MAALRLKERLEFDALKAVEDPLAYAVVQSLANNGHGDIGSCGVAEFNLIEFAEALDTPPGETLRRLKALAAPISALCVEHENTILFALAGADQAGSRISTRAVASKVLPQICRRSPRVIGGFED
jgi:hypothetical protein